MMNVGYATWSFEASAVLMGALGLLSLARRGNLLVTILFAMSLFLAAVAQLGAAALVRSPAQFAASPWHAAAGLLLVVTGLSWAALSFSLGRPGPGSRLRRALPFLLAWAALGVAAAAEHGPTRWMVAGEQVEPSLPQRLLLGPGVPWLVCWLLVTLVAVITNFEATLRNARGTALRRLRLMLLAMMAVMGLHILLMAQALLYHYVPLSHLALAGWGTFAGSILTAYSLVRHRVSDLSVPAARPVVYSAVTTLVIGGYLLLTAAVAEISRHLGSAPPALGIPVVVALLVGGLGIAIFAPRLFRRVRHFVDRNLYAQRYDYRHEWSRVSRHLNPSHPLPELAASVSELVGSVVGASEVHVLLRNGELLEPTGQAPGGAGEPAGGSAGAPVSLPLDHPVTRALCQTGRPRLLEGEGTDLDGIPVLVEGTRLWGGAAPAVASGLFVNQELVGLVLLGRKGSGEKYNAEDLELLEAMSHQLAHVLWARRLSDQLVEARELESFHRLASFVLHDLKNILSGLSLTLRNAESRWQDPAFREIALRSVGASVDRMKLLMERVSGARPCGELTTAPCDVRELLEESLAAALGSARGAGDTSGAAGAASDRIRVSCVAEGLPPVVADRGRLLSVFQNLIRNACEAMPEGGTLSIHAATRPSPGTGAAGVATDGRELVVSVRDSGAGMDPEFMQRKLFHPFSSTKQRGFGLGLYQSRSIVEAHGGRMEVQSEVGRGSEFRVVLPLAGSAAAD